MADDRHIRVCQRCGDVFDTPSAERVLCWGCTDKHQNDFVIRVEFMHKRSILAGKARRAYNERRKANDDRND